MHRPSITPPMRWSRRIAAAIALLGVLAALMEARPGSAQRPTWWKGNLHTHSLWSDGDDFPEMITQWYRDHGYHFLGISDHNAIHEGRRWIDTERLNGAPRALREYRYRFGDDWVEERTVAGKPQVRLKTLAEYRSRFEEPGRFLLIPCEEITDSHDRVPVHLNATNVRRLIPPQGGNTVLDIMQRNVNAVWEQRRRTGQPMIPHLNHPNFRWAITAEDLAAVRGERFFEVYNGHPLVHNEGDALRASTDRMWDVALSIRLTGPNPEPLWGMGVDDAHNYHVFESKRSLAGRGWIQVRASELSSPSLIAALEAGEFYASSGVELADVRREEGRLWVEIVPQPGVRYRIQFIGTRRGTPLRGEPIRDKQGYTLNTTMSYSPSIGELLAERSGTSASYRLRGDELYVRAKILSTRRKVLSPVAGETECAWTQPLIPSLSP